MNVKLIQEGFFFLFIMLSLSCGANSFLSSVESADRQAASTEDAPGVELASNDYQGTVDEQGNVTDLPGFSKNSKIAVNGDGQETISREDILSNENEVLFSYESPDGGESEVSQPVMVTGSFLALTAIDTNSVCSGLEFSKNIPTYGSLPQETGTYRFCIRVQINGAYLYRLTPNFRVSWSLPTGDIGGVNGGNPPPANNPPPGPPQNSSSVNLSIPVTGNMLSDCSYVNETKDRIICNFAGSYTKGNYLAANFSIQGSGSTDLNLQDYQVRFTGSQSPITLRVNMTPEIGAMVSSVSGTAVETPDCSSIPGLWVPVPGDPDYGTTDFCVMKYEAQCASAASGQGCLLSDLPSSSLNDNFPWTIINHPDAKARCLALGSGYHLISNDQWMTLSGNIAGVGTNWSSGTVGTGQIFQGHSDNSPGFRCNTSTNDALAYVEGSDCTFLGASGGEDDEASQRRTHTLSNGSVVWDLAGNVAEWVDYFQLSDKPGTVNGWDPYTLNHGSDSLPLSRLIPTTKSYWDNSWLSLSGIGQLHVGELTSGGAMDRGGDRLSSTGGIFHARLRFDAFYTGTLHGFRCTYQ